MSGNGDQPPLFDTPSADQPAYDEEYYRRNEGHLNDPGNPFEGHAIGRDHASTADDAEYQSRPHQARERPHALKQVYEAGAHGITPIECAEPHLAIYRSPNQCSVSFIWMRRRGWARRVLASERPPAADEKVVTAPNGGPYLARATGTSRGWSVIHVMTDEGRMEYARRYLP